MSLHGEHGSAWRRRQRRLRSWWRHEQQSVAMALSAAAHHSFDKVAAGERYDGLRAQKTDRAGEAAHSAPRRQRTKAAGEAVFFELFDEDTAGVRPKVLAEPRPQERVQRHTMEHIVDFVCCAPMVQILDALVPQTVEQLPDVLQFFGTLTTDPEQVIDVPKILPEDVPMRAVLRDPQLAEQLVEVPTIVSYSWLQLRMEQNVDIPVPGRGGRRSGLHGFPPRQGSTALHSSEERISGQIVEQLVDIQGGGLQDFRPGFSLSSSYFPVGVPKLWMSLVKGFFALIPKIEKSAKSGSHSRQRVPASFSPSTPAPQQRVRLKEWVMFMNEHGLYYWNMDIGEKRWQLESSLVVARWPVRRPWRQLTMVTWWWVLVRGGADCAWVLLVSYGGFWKNFLFYVAAVALFAPGNLDLPSPLLSFVLVYGCCLWSTSYWFSGTLALLGSTVDTCLRDALVNFQLFPC